MTGERVESTRCSVGNARSRGKEGRVDWGWQRREELGKEVSMEREGYYGVRRTMEAIEV
jgi:hypothetical protein